MGQQTLDVTEQGWLILDAVDRFLLEYDRWESTQDEEEADYLDGRVSDALDGLLALPSEAPKGFQGLMQSIEKLRHVSSALDDQGSIFSLVDGGDRMEFFRSVDNLKTVRNRKYSVAHNPESVRTLMAMPGMGTQQVARMFGLVEADGRLRLDLVERENVNPGSVIGPDNLPKDDVEGWEKPLAFPPCRITIRRAPRGKDLAKSAGAKQSAPCPETSYELFLLSLDKHAPLTVRQAASMLQRPEADVLAEWEGFRKDQRLKDRLADLRELEARTGRPAPVAVGKIEEDDEDDGRPSVEPGDADDSLASEYESWEEADLRELCRERGIAAAPNSKKATLIAKLLAADAAEVESEAA